MWLRPNPRNICHKDCLRVLHFGGDVCVHAHVWAHDSFLLLLGLLESLTWGIASPRYIHPWLSPFLLLHETLLQGCLWPAYVQSTGNFSVFVLHSSPLPLSGTGTLGPQPWVLVAKGKLRPWEIIPGGKSMKWSSKRGFEILTDLSIILGGAVTFTSEGGHTFCSLISMGLWPEQVVREIFLTFYSWCIWCGPSVSVHSITPSFILKNISLWRRNYIVIPPSKALC